jgi:hypothetical protein
MTLQDEENQNMRRRQSQDKHDKTITRQSQDKKKITTRQDEDKDLARAEAEHFAEHT